MKNKFLKRKLFCFTPELALATFIVEISLAIYVFIKDRTSKIGKIAIFTLILLSMFQLSEYLLCAGYDNYFWHLVGGLSITFLPAIGLHLVSVLTGRKILHRIFYSFGIIFCLMMIFIPGVITGATCAGNYVVFRTLTYDLVSIYKYYYYLGLTLTVIEALIGLRMFKDDPLKRKLLGSMVLGYLSFMGPTSVIILIPSFGLKSLPSVLCGFAVIFALILAFVIVPTAKKLNI